MRPARMLMSPEMDGLYHVVSRVVDRRMIFGEEEKKRFRDLLVAYAGFSGIEVVAWCLMDNHFHLLLKVPSRERADPAKLSEKEILRRLALIYRDNEMVDIKRVLGMCQSEESRRSYLERYTKRMGDLPRFMCALKQRFSRWYNGRQKRKGTLWEDRYRSVVLEIQDGSTLGHAARIVAAYIDLNPVRAGMVEDPKDYPWCGYGRAVLGEKSSVRGVLSVWGRTQGVKAALAAYRVFLFEEGREGRDARGEKSGRKGIDARKVWEERKRGGRLPLSVMLRMKSRYLVDGAAIGSTEFIWRLTGGSAVRPMEEQVAGGVEAQDEIEASEGAVMRFGQWGGLRVLRNLRVGVVG